MKKILAIIIFVSISLSAPSTLWGDNVNKIVRFDSKTYDFGDVLLSDGTINCTFSFENISGKPVVIHNVISSCGCTTPEWTKEPVMPGGKGRIEASYSNDQEGTFDKTLTVYVSDVSRPIVLRLRGCSHSTIKNLSELYPVKAGAIGLRNDNFSLGYIDQHSYKGDDTQIANLSGSPMRISAVEMTNGLSVSFSENPIPARSTARLTYTIDLSKISPEKWGRQNFTFKIAANGAIQNKTFTVKALIKEGFDNLSKSEIASSPTIEVKKSYFEFGNIKKGEKKNSSFLISNKGKKTLVIHTVDVQSAAISIQTDFPVTIEPGCQKQLTVKYDSSKCKSIGEVVDILTVISNAPGTPVLNLYVTGIVIN